MTLKTIFLFLVLIVSDTSLYTLNNSLWDRFTIQLNAYENNPTSNTAHRLFSAYKSLQSTNTPQVSQEWKNRSQQIMEKFKDDKLLKKLLTKITLTPSSTPVKQQELSASVVEDQGTQNTPEEQAPPKVSDGLPHEELPHQAEDEPVSLQDKVQHALNAKKTLEDQVTLLNEQITSLQKNLIDLKTENSKKHDDLNVKLDENQTLRTKLENEIQNLKSVTNQEQLDLKARLAKVLLQKNTELEDLQQADVDLTATTVHTEESLSSLIDKLTHRYNELLQKLQDLTQCTSQASDLTNRIAKLEDTNSDLQENIEKLENQHKNDLSTINDLGHKNSAIGQTLDNQASELKTLKDQLFESNNSITKLKQDLTQATENGMALVERLHNLNQTTVYEETNRLATINKLTSELQEEKLRCQELASTTQAPSDQTIETLESENTDLRQKNTALTDLLDEYKIDLDKKNQEIENNKRLISVLQLSNNKLLADYDALIKKKQMMKQQKEMNSKEDHLKPRPRTSYSRIRA
jgi:chromosome segregation ATPase